jgi:hypothetical protein
MILLAVPDRSAEATTPPVPPPSPAIATRPGTKDGEEAPPTPPETNDSKLRFDTRSFVYARLSTAHSSALYAGYSFGTAGVFFGVVQNPRSGYREWIGGVVARLSAGQQAVSLAVAYADASGEKYVQVYAVPNLRAGPWSLSGTVELYEPWHGAGTRQLYLDPLTLLRRLGRRWEAGASYTLSVAAGGEPEHRAGPALQVAWLGGSIRAELLFGRSSSDVRVGYQASF